MIKKYGSFVAGMAAMLLVASLVGSVFAASSRVEYNQAGISLFSAASFAQSVSATASTLDRAEAKIAAQAAEQGASYKITSAQFNNRVHMTAELSK